MPLLVLGAGNPEGIRVGSCLRKAWNLVKTEKIIGITSYSTILMESGQNPFQTVAFALVFKST